MQGLDQLMHLCYAAAKQAQGPDSPSMKVATMRMQPISWFFVGSVLLAGTFLSPVPECTAASIGELTDLTGKATAIITFKGRDIFTSEFQYDISIRNQSGDAFIADSLVVVLDKITNIAGEEREALKSETILSRFEVLGQDGETDDGKPFFRIPVGAGPDLASHSDSLPVSVRIRNKDYVAFFTPTFRVYGKMRPAPEPKQQLAKPPPGRPGNQTEKLIQLLLKKGIITEEEWRNATQP
jgi:hypothetical protein